MTRLWNGRSEDDPDVVATWALFDLDEDGLDALRDDFDVTLVCGDLLATSRSADVILDATCRINQGDGDLRRSARRAASAIHRELRGGRPARIPGITDPSRPALSPGAARRP